MSVREIVRDDLDALLELYTYLHDNPIPETDGSLASLWESILADDKHHIIVAVYDGKIVSSCVCVIIQNLTHGQRPYALVENVVTHPGYRGRGIATACLDYAKKLAKDSDCYKLMLMTGSKKESTLRFYERAGYNSKDKTAFIQWL